MTQAIPEPEFSRIVELDRLGEGVRTITANSEERAALARRFGLVRIDQLDAQVTLTPQGQAIAADGRIQAKFVQSCAVSGDDLPVTVDEPLHLRFVPAQNRRPDEEVELDESDCDEIEYEGGRFDLGEAVAQTLALAIDPFAVGPNAEKARKEAGLLDESAAGPFAALAALTKKKE